MQRMLITQVQGIQRCEYNMSIAILNSLMNWLFLVVKLVE